MSIHYGQSCPVSKAAEVLGERWTILIIRELLLGTSRFSDFQRALSQISPTLLTKRLNQLQDWGLVMRKTGSGGQRPEYYLTAAGIELKPIVLGLGEWGMKWRAGRWVTMSWMWRCSCSISAVESTGRNCPLGRR
jgi:DNA-binding HxlR family transcriptional regulator